VAAAAAPVFYCEECGTELLTDGRCPRCTIGQIFGDQPATAFRGQSWLWG
ncbi:unnamed protein product, partial [Symbiodinium natans]